MGMQCAELHGHFPPYELARRVVELGQRFEHALMAVERNNHGYAVLAHLEYLGYENFFDERWAVGMADIGGYSSGDDREYGGGAGAEPELFHSPRLLEECRTFVRRADGNTAAADGAHDDCVMAMAIALAVRREDAGRGVKKRGVRDGKPGGCDACGNRRMFICHSKSVEMEYDVGLCRKGQVAIYEFRGRGRPRHTDIGGSGPTREKNAGRRARTFDALFRRAILRGEVPEQSAAPASADE